MPDFQADNHVDIRADSKTIGIAPRGCWNKEMVAVLNDDAELCRSLALAICPALAELESDLAAARGEVERLKREVKSWSDAALVSLAGLVPTPAIGYLKDGGVGLFESNAHELRELHKAALSRTESAERELSDIEDYTTKLWEQVSAAAGKPLRSDEIPGEIERLKRAQDDLLSEGFSDRINRLWILSDGNGDCMTDWAANEIERLRSELAELKSKGGA